MKKTTLLVSMMVAGGGLGSAVLGACGTDEFATADAGPDVVADSVAKLDSASEDAPANDVSDAGPSTFCTTHPSAKDALSCLDFDLLSADSGLTFTGWTARLAPIWGWSHLFTPADNAHDGGSPSAPNHMWLRYFAGAGAYNPDDRRAQYTFDVPNSKSTITLDFELRVDEASAAGELVELASIYAVTGSTKIYGVSLQREVNNFTAWVLDSGGPVPLLLGQTLQLGWHHVKLSITSGQPGSYSAQIDSQATKAGNGDFSAGVSNFVVAFGVTNRTPLTGSSNGQNNFYDNVVVHAN